MAQTFELPSKSTLYDAGDPSGALKYKIVIKENNMESTTSRVRKVNISVLFARISSGTTDRAGTIYCKINGTEYSRTLEYGKNIINYNSFTTLFSKDINVQYDDLGKAKISVYAKWNIPSIPASGQTAGDAYVCNYQGGTVSLTTIPVNTYTVSYNANGGSNAPSSQTKTYNVNLTLSSDIPTRSVVEDNGLITEYTFKGWDTDSKGTTVQYAAGAVYTENAPVTLYAVWSSTQSVNNFTVSYNSLGGSQVASQIKIKDKTLKLRNAAPIKYGYNFSGWGLSADSTTVSYNLGDNYTLNADLLLYAIWIPWTHTVTFNANGGTGDVPSDFVKTTEQFVEIPIIEPIKDNCIFKCWCTNPNGYGGTNYYGLDEYTGLQDGGIITLYAVWKEKKIVIYTNKQCEATEFIEIYDSSYFKNDGTIYSSEFIEDDTVSLTNLVYHFGELVER